MAIERFLDEIPSTLGFDSRMPYLFIAKVNPFHMIFNLNKVLIVTRFDKCFHTVIFRLGLKEFLEKCLVQFQMYIWSTTQHHNIYNYLDQTWHKTQISIHVFGVFDQDFYM
jgi:hypothetical protein